MLPTNVSKILGIKNIFLGRHGHVLTALSSSISIYTVFPIYDGNKPSVEHTLE